LKIQLKGARERGVFHSLKEGNMDENSQVNEVPAEFIGSEEKLEAVRPKLDAIKEEEVRWFKLNVLSTVTSAIRVWQSYSADKPLFAKTFTAEGFDAAGLSDLPLRIGALWYSDVLLGQVMKPTRTLPGEIINEAKPLHAKLAAAALYLFKNDPTLGPQVMSIREGSGYLDMAGDLVRYASLFTSLWNAVQNRCDITESDLKSEKRLSPIMLEGLTAVPAKELEARRDLRDRAAEYLCRGVEEIRDAATYVFRKKPSRLSQYPSLYSSRGPSRKTKPEETAEVSTTSASN
jgi:hypothetical protein